MEAVITNGIPHPSTEPLHALSHRFGIADGYVDQNGKKHQTTDATRIALLNAIGVEITPSGQNASDLLASLAVLQSQSILDGPIVCRIPDHAGLTAAQLPIHIRIPQSCTASELRWQITITTEAEHHVSATGRIRRPLQHKKAIHSSAHQTHRLRWPSSSPTPKLPLGYHQLTVNISTPLQAWCSTVTLIICPARCFQWQGTQAWGIWCNLYSLRSQHNFGVGDFGDLTTLLHRTAAAGGDFVGINPLHALVNQGMDISPYSPLSRIYRNPLYIDVEDLARTVGASSSQVMNAMPENTSEQLSALRHASWLDYGSVSDLKTKALHHIYAHFLHHTETTHPHKRAFTHYKQQQGPLLVQFAQYMLKRSHAHQPQLPSTTSASETLDFHMYLQFAIDQQLAKAAHLAQQSGMRIGLYQDLAIGVGSHSFDTQAFPTIFAKHVSLGAPPDAYAAQGQDWGLPPLNPHALRTSNYSYWIHVLRSATAHTGALRIDHAMGLLRQFWIPEGMNGTAGAYVRFPWHDLVSILALESHRRRTIIIGEDLGTVPPGFQARLAAHGMLSSRVICFERTRRGVFKRARAYSNRALVTVNTHDMPPLRGYMAGRDITLRQAVPENIPDTGSWNDARDSRKRDVRSLLSRLTQDRLLTHSNTDTHSDHATIIEERAKQIVAALHQFIKRTPAPLVAYSLDDLAGESEPINLPGVKLEHYPSWQRRMQKSVSKIDI